MLLSLLLLLSSLNVDDFVNYNQQYSPFRSSGLVCVIRIELGVLSSGKLGPVEIVSEYIQNGKYSQVFSLLLCPSIFAIEFCAPFWRKIAATENAILTNNFNFVFHAPKRNAFISKISS